MKSFRVAGIAFVMFLPATSLAETDNGRDEHLKHVNQYDQPWLADPGIPHGDAARWRTLLGTGGIFGNGLPDRDFYIRQGEMGPGASYPVHRHPSNELWYLIEGDARWTVDGESFDAEPGSAVYLKPGAVRSVEITSKNKANIIRGNWGINCDREIMLNTFGNNSDGSVEDNRGYIYAGEYTYETYPQPDRARLPVWDYGDSRQPGEGSNSNLAPPLSADSEVHLKHINYHDVRFAPDPTGVRHWKTLVGAGSGDWGEGLPDKELQWGIGELGSGGIYDHHHHASPELYYFITGRALITVDGDEFVADPGELIYHKPWAMHKSIITSKGKAVVMWADWSPDCDRSVLQKPYELLDEMPVQPDSAQLPR